MQTLHDAINNTLHAFEDLQRDHEALEASTKSLQVTINSLTEQCASQQRTIEALQMEIKVYQESLNKASNVIKQLEDDKAAFAKVSHIIAMEKENARLKKEIEQLQLSQTKQRGANETKMEAIPSSYDSGPQMVDADKQGPELTTTKETSEVTVAYHEKKIKGIMYLVSSDGILMERNDDGTSGTRLGMLKKTTDGKTKVVWDK